jgi:hypothetical protein
MAGKSKSSEIRYTGEHRIRIEQTKSQMMNRDLFQPICSCGWTTPKWGTEGQAFVAGGNHTAEQG